MVILLIAIGGYSINGYWWLLVAILLMAIVAIGGYLWLLVVILLMVINGDWWLFY